MTRKKANPRSIYPVWLMLLVGLYPVLRLTKYKVFFLLIGAALYSFIILSMGRKSFFQSMWTALLVYAFLGIPFLSALWSIQPSNTLFHAGVLAAYGSIFTMSHVIFLRQKINWLYSLSIVVGICYGMIFFAVLMRFGTVRPESLYMDEKIGSISNHIPAIVLPTLPYLYMSWKKRHRRILVGICSLLLLFVVIISESRAAYGLLMAQVVLIPFFTAPSLWSAMRKAAPALITAAIVGVMAYFIAGQEIAGSVIERFSESQLLQGNFSTQYEGGQDFARIAMIRESINIISSNPLTGIGYHTFKEYMTARYGFGMISHNILSTVWGEMGILGLITFSGVVIGAFRRASYVQERALEQKRFERWRFMAATKAALVVLLLHALVRPQLTNPMLFIILAAPYGLGTR